MSNPDQVALIENASRRYLETLRSATGEPHERYAMLASALDALCVAYHQSIDVELNEDAEAPCADPSPLGKQAARSFPEFGFYADVDPLGPANQPVGQGWGLDDLIDIAVDLTGVLWLIEHRHFDCAVWDFRFGYQTHWGDHLHNLRRYLHRLRYW